MYQSTVPQLVEQWYHTVGEKLSIEERERKYGNSWRKDPNTSQNYYRRNRIINWVNSIAEENSLSRNQASNILEYFRIKDKATLSQIAMFRESESLEEEIIELAEDSRVEEKLREIGLNFARDADYEVY